MRTATKLAIAGSGMIAALAMTAGPAQAGPRKDDPDVKAACAAFNRLGDEMGLWDHYDCADWTVNRQNTVVTVRHDGRHRHRHGAWPIINIGSRLPVRADLPSVVNINGPSGSYTLPVGGHGGKPPKAARH